jgi:hypothetical protein
MLLNKLVRIPVGTDVSRPFGITILDEDVILLFDKLQRM